MKQVTAREFFAGITFLILEFTREKDEEYCSWEDQASFAYKLADILVKEGDKEVVNKIKPPKYERGKK